MSCRRWRKWLSAYVDGELTGRRVAKLESHLERCLTCRHHLAVLRKMSSLVGRQVSNPVPAGMAEVILRQTVGSDSAARRHVVDLGAWRLRWLPDTERLVVAAALVVAILGSFVFWRQFVARPEVPIHYFEEEYAYAQEISSFPVDHTVLSDLTYE